MTPTYTLFKPTPSTHTHLSHTQVHQFEGVGDVLLFLTGEEEIEEACRYA
jgi:HrpA-like RNA helicase